MKSFFKIYIKAVFFLLLFMCNHCAYRFSNLYKKAPSGIQSVAIEAIYDSSKNIFPHEILWNSLQRQVITSGKLDLSSVQRADALLRVHLVDTQKTQFNAEYFVERQDPKTFHSSTTGLPYRPKDYVDQKTASHFAKWERASYMIIVEVWDLRTQEQLNKKAYPVAFDRKTFYGSTPSQHRYPYILEGFETAFTTSTQQLAERIIGDFLSL